MESSTAKAFVLSLNQEDPVSQKLAAMKIEYRDFSSVGALVAEVDLVGSGCVVADLNHFGIGGMDVLDQLNQRQSTLPLILVSNRVSTRLVVRIMREGALTLLERPFDEDELFFAIREAMDLNQRRVLANEEMQAARTRFELLVDSEFQVLEAICSGKTNKQIASFLEISVRTVEARKKRILNKTQCRSQPELIIAYHQFKSLPARRGPASTWPGNASRHSVFRSPVSGVVDWNAMGKSA